MSEQEISITVEVTTIRDGSHGISIAAPDKLIGEFPDSKATSLTLTDNLAISVRGEHDEQRYLLCVPGTPVRGQQISDTKAVIVIRL